MKKQANQILSKASLSFLGAALLLGAGCAISHVAPVGQAKPTVSSPSGKGGSQLWAENCVRCHHVRSPSSYSDGEWEVAMLHMRIRANLTAEDHQKILEFLKSAN